MPWGHASSGHTKTYMSDTTKPAPEGPAAFDYSDKQMTDLLEFPPAEFVDSLLG